MVASVPALARMPANPGSPGADVRGGLPFGGPGDAGPVPSSPTAQGGDLGGVVPPSLPPTGSAAPLPPVPFPGCEAAIAAALTEAAEGAEAVPPLPPPPPAPAPTPPQEDAAQTRINVAVRCRPLSDTERNGGAQDICRVMDGRLVLLLDPGVAASNDYLRLDKSKEKRFAFDQAFGQEAGTQTLFDALAGPLIESVLQAFNSSLLAYGATGAGKTFTMIGTATMPGVMLRTVEALFNRVDSSAVAVRCSFIEVYNENLRDLLAADSREGFLDIREDPARGMCVVGVTETQTESTAEVLELLRQGNRRRTTEPTAMNVTSSRSHAVLQIAVEQRDPRSQEVMLGKLSMIDLAGSERASATGNRGERFIEGANINKSLLALGNCINALASGSSFVPYRDSKLTRLLKDSLGGNCVTTMLANISPSHHSYEDTLNTLKYANRAKNIRVSAHQNISQEPQQHVGEYQKIIGDLRSEVEMLKARLVRKGSSSLAEPSAPLVEDGDDEGDVGVHEASEHWKEEVVRNLEGRTQLQRSLIEVDRGLSRWRVERARVTDIVERWDERQAGASQFDWRGQPGRSQRRDRSQPRSLAEWRDHLSQIEESIRENTETRSSIEARLEQNRAAGRELHAQLPQRVVNEDIRAFLELIQRVQVLEVERLQLDHFWEQRRNQLESRDQEIALLREQLRLRVEHLQRQRELLSDEQQEQLPGRVSLLGSTLAEGPLAQQRGPIRVMQAWVQTPKDQHEEMSLDSRPLREREPKPQPKPRPRPPQLSEEGDLGATAMAEALRDLQAPSEAIDWRSVAVPRASQLRGAARLQPPGQGGSITAPPGPAGALGLAPVASGAAGVPRPAGKGWREPPGVRLPPAAPGPAPAPSPMSPSHQQQQQQEQLKRQQQQQQQQHQAPTGVAHMRPRAPSAPSSAAPLHSHGGGSEGPNGPFKPTSGGGAPRRRNSPVATSQQRGSTCPPPGQGQRGAPRRRPSREDGGAGLGHGDEGPPPSSRRLASGSRDAKMEAEGVAAKPFLQQLQLAMANRAPKPFSVDPIPEKAVPDMAPLFNDKAVAGSGSGGGGPGGIAAAPSAGGNASAAGRRQRRGNSRGRARSEQVGSRMNRFGRIIVQPRQQERRRRSPPSSR